MRHARSTASLFLLVVTSILAACVGTGTPLLAQTAPAAADSSLLPPLPATVWSAQGPVVVWRVDPTPCGPNPTIGCFNRVARWVAISDTIPRLLSWIVLEHEKAHIYFRDYGILFPSAVAEDSAAQAIALGRVREQIVARKVEQQRVLQAGQPRAPQ